MPYRETESDVAPTESFMSGSANPDEFSHGLLRETSESFEDWLGDLQASPSSDQADLVYPPIGPREINFEGTLRVDGYMAGVVRSAQGTLIVSAAGEVDGVVLVDVALIQGCVRGDIRAATKVEIGSAGRVIGDIETLELMIQPGATFEGRCALLPRPKKSPDTAVDENERAEADVEGDLIAAPAS